MTTPAVKPFLIKAHDSLPVISAKLSYDDGTVPDLTRPDTSVLFIMAKPKEPFKVKASAQILQGSPADPCVVRYLWKHDGSDTDVAGEGWRGEWEVTFPDGSRQTFPTGNYHAITILEDADYQTP